MKASSQWSGKIKSSISRKQGLVLVVTWSTKAPQLFD